jgi:hypothetical protein
MSFDAQQRQLALAALNELNAAEPNRTPAHLLGGDVAWGSDVVARVEAARDPANALAMRPHVVAPCQALASHRPLRLRCSCGRTLEFLALAPFATGVLVVSSPRLVPLESRGGGGVSDLAPIGTDDPEARWSLLAWEAHMQVRVQEAARTTAWDADGIHPVLGANVSLVGDTAKRTVFVCEHCAATHTLLNMTLLRQVLEAIANDERDIHLARAEATAAPR